MEDPESESKSFSSSKTNDEATVVKWIMANGYVIGKEMAITGMIISSAPLVVPPLVVVSAMGVAVSVPFGVLFATYACTNKFMSMLLPPPVPIMQRCYCYCTDGFEVEKDERKLGLDCYVVEANEDDHISHEGNTREMNEDAKLRGEERVNDVVFGDDNDVETVETGEPVMVREIESEKVEEKGSEPVGEMRHVVILSAGNDENNFNSDELDLVAREVMDDANEDERNTVSDEKVMRESNEENEGKENDANDNVDVLVHPPSTRDTDDAYKKMPSREENVDDKKIWEKIAAIRTIVGYKAPAQPTCLGELKALYLFTGVEPSASFEGDLDLEAKLKFLMAIVGVK